MLDRDSKTELDTIIDDYEDFKELFWICVRKMKIGEEKNLKEILGKHIRRIDMQTIQKFEELLNKDVLSKNIAGMTIGKIEKDKNGVQLQYYIKDLPRMTFT